jgi:hypothetical protein
LKKIKKIARFLFNFFVISIVTLILLEVTYRYQWIDFYSTEWTALNKNQKNTTDDKTLIFGDSFSAEPNGWVVKLRDLDTNTTYFNASIPGVGLETFRLIAEDRLEEVKPSRVIIQLYVGNDLYDYEKPVNWSELSVLRNLYWSMGSNFRVLTYLNYKSGQFFTNSISTGSKLEDSFSVSNYSRRTKLYIDADSAFPVSAINLEGKSSETFNEMVEVLNQISQILNDDTELSVLVIPHCTQVHQKYRNRFISLGCDLSELKIKGSLWSKKLKDKGFNVLDPLAVFKKEEEQGEELYFQNDPHLNSKGQKVLSSYILKQLQ